ncbi:COesterase domain containing protein, partial [Asbolus verrucosus]
YSEEDQITQKRLLKIWTNFAKYQNPTPKPTELLQHITWPSISTNDKFFYVDIGDNLTIRNYPKKETYQEWEKLYNSLGYNNFDTY